MATKIIGMGSLNNIKVNDLEKSLDAKLGIREAILNFENNLKKIEGHTQGDSPLFPLKHTYSDGIYVREIKIPKGYLLTGKIHKHAHPNFLMEGEVLVVTEDGGQEVLKAPLSMISPAGTKRALYSLTDLVWVTVHHNPTNTQDLEEIEDIVIAKTYSEFERFNNQKKSLLSKIKLNIIKKLL